MSVEPVRCIYCQQVCYAPRLHSEYRTSGPRAEWGTFYQVEQSHQEEGQTGGQPAESGYLYVYAVCQPSCRANAAVARYEAARLEIEASLRELQAAVVEALAEVGEAWRSLDQ